MNGNGPKVDITARIDATQPHKEIDALMRQTNRSIGSLGNTVANYTKRVETLIKDLDAITRPGSNAGQTVRDIALSGGGTVPGRLRQASAQNIKSQQNQIQEVLTADLLNSQAEIFRKVARGVKSATITQLASRRQEIASIDAEIRKAQIEAQRARVGFAAQLSGTRGSVRGTITENANSLGVQGLGTLKLEQAALDKLVASEANYAAEAKIATRELREQESLQNRIKTLAEARTNPLQRQIEMLMKENAIRQQNYNIAQAEARGDASGALKAKLKQESLRLDQMALRGMKEESAEFQGQIGKIRILVDEQNRLNAAKAKTLTETREQSQLEASRQFAAGEGSRGEIMQNNLIGARKVSSSVESRASLLGMQGNLLMNYALLGGATAALGGTAMAVVDLDAKLRELQAIAGATNGEFEGLRQVVLKTSESTKFSAVDLAEAATQLAQVGQSTAQIEKSLPVISAFAMAVGTDMKSAVDITTTALSVFNMTSDQTQRVANVMTEALNRSKLTMDQLATGFQYAANIAADSGVTFEELTAVLAGMSQAGIRGSMAGTGIRQVMMSLAAPTEEVTNLISSLGLSMDQVDVRTQGLTGVLKNFADAGLTAGQAMSVFETRTAAALIAATNQVDFMQGVQQSFTYTRAAEEAAAVQSESFKNSTLELKNEFLSFMNDALNPLLKMLISGAKGMKDFGNSIGPIVPTMKFLTAAIVAFFAITTVASIGKLAMGFLKFSGVVEGMTAVVPRLTTAYTALTLATTASGGAMVRFGLIMEGIKAVMPELLIISAVAAAIVAVAMASGKATNSAKDFNEEMDKQKTAMNAARAEQDKYDQVMNQIDQTIARVKARSGELRDGSRALHIEIMQGAAAFNEYGAGIDSNNVKLDTYIDRLQGAKAAVAALSEEQARQAAKDAAELAATSRKKFEDSLLEATSLGGSGRGSLSFDPRQLTAQARASGKLTPTQLGIFQSSASALDPLLDADPSSITGDKLASFLDKVNTFVLLMSKVDANSPWVERLRATQLAGAASLTATANSDQAQTTVEAKALQQSEGFLAITRTLEPWLRDLEGVREALRQSAITTRGNPAAALASSDSVLTNYGRQYRQTEGMIRGARAGFNEETATAAQKEAFEATMAPLEERLVQIREVLERTQTDNNEKATAQLTSLQQLVNLPVTKPFEELMKQAIDMGLHPEQGGVKDTAELKDWITNELIRRDKINVDELLGRDSAMSLQRYGVQRDVTSLSGAVAERDRIPMAQRIRDMATQYGLSPDLMRNVASYETGGRFNADATNPKSSARGLFQIMADTWNEFRDEKVPTGRAGVADRNPNDPRLNAEQNMTFAMEEMTRRLAQMQTNLGRRPEDWEMYLAWQQGVAGATNIIKNPNAMLAGTVGREEASLNGGQGLTNGQFSQKVSETYARQRTNSSQEGSRDIGEASEALANSLRKATETVGEAARVSSTTARALVTRTMRNLDQNTTDEDGFAAVDQITSSLREVSNGISLFYDSKIAANRKFKADMLAAGRLTPEKAQQLDQELEELNTSFDNEMDRVREDTVSTFTDLYTKLPQFLGSVKKTIDTVNLTLSELQNQLDTSEQSVALNAAKARDEVFSDVDARGVANGRFSGAYANARSVLRERDTRGREEAYAPAQLSNQIMQQAAIRNGLNKSLGYSNLTLGNVTASRLAQEQTTLSGMNKDNTDEKTLAKQIALVAVLNDNLQGANDLRAQYAALDLQITANQEAQNEMVGDTKEQVRAMIEAWGVSNGTFSSLLNDAVAGVPAILDTVSGSFSTFFSDVLSGTATLKDAFRSLATSILKSMMDVVASAAAKQLMRLVLNIGASLFGGGQGPVPSDLNGLYREGGLIHAREGYGPVRGRDSVNIKTMPGEYVLRKSAVDAIGVDNLNQINAQGNRMVSGAGAAQPVKMMSPVSQGQPLSIYVVSPDKQPPPSKDQIVVMVQEDMINRGPVYKAVKAVQSGAI